MLNAPTGFGKTVTYAAMAILGDLRAAFLTSTKGLQSQLLRDFSECGLVDIRGQQNYLCRALQPDGIHYKHGIRSGDRCDAGPCHIGAPCSARKNGCDYFDQFKKSQQSKLISTNYTYWIQEHRFSESLGRFGLLVCDEAHAAPDELAGALEIELSGYDVQMATGFPLPAGEDPDEWKRWAQLPNNIALEKISELEADIKELLAEQKAIPSTMGRELHFLRGVQAKLLQIVEMDRPWTVERLPHSAKLAPVWPAPYAEGNLFLGISKVVLVSATIKEKTLELLGVDPAASEFHEYPSTFPPHRRPVIHVPSVRCHHNWSDVEQRTWVRRIDEVLDRRQDRKGVIHTTSYGRRDLILTHSRHRHLMLYNDGTNTRQIVEKFRRAEPPCILVSPSLTTGWDLPFETCEYAIIAKIPFPDTRSRITKARTQLDKTYGPYCAMQTIVQAAGRGMRSADDQCEILILDDQWIWFWRDYHRFAPRWFREAVDRRRHIDIPDPLPKLNQGETYV